MKPDWKPVLAGDAAFEDGVVKFAAPAYGVGDLRDLPTTAPDDRTFGNGWTCERVPNANTPDSRFIATRLD